MSGGADETARRLALGAEAAVGGAGWTPPTAEELADVFPGLRVLALAGRGGMGAVYRAEQVSLGRVVALKILAPGATPDPLARERFDREARVLAGIAHAQVVGIFDYGRLADGTPYLVTEWAEGGDLATVAAGRAQTPERVVAWVGQIAAALDAAHAKGVVHRDLKPANVLVRADGSLALADFGLARAEGAGFTTALTLSGTIFGTFDYMAPEQMGPAGEAGAEITPAVDVYALGVMTYQLLTGRVPRGVFVKASKVAGVPLAVDAVLEAAMANEAGRRPRSAGEFARALEAAMGKARRGRRGLPVARVAVWAGAVIVAAAVAVRAWREEGGSVVRGEAPSSRADALTGRPAADASWADALSDVRTARHGIGGGWTRRGAELVSDSAVCTLRLPVDAARLAAAGYRYDLAVEFTRTAGANSVAVFLPTSVGTGVFELDAWEAGLGGLQMIDERDLRESGEHFPATLRNGERQTVLLEVRGARVTASWNGAVRRAWDLKGRRLSIASLWEVGELTQPGLASWKSPTVFHLAEWRVVAAE